MINCVLRANNYQRITATENKAENESSLGRPYVNVFSIWLLKKEFLSAGWKIRLK